MRASVKADWTVREIHIEVSGVPDVDATREWNSRLRIFSPDLVRITIVSDEVRQVETFGHLRRVSGQLSMKARDKEVWRAQEAVKGLSQPLDAAPAWLRTLVANVLEGMTSWEPDAD